MKQLRPYQQEAIDAINKSLSKGISKMMIVIPTGGGKTFTAVQAIKNMGRILWCTHTEELISQSLKALLTEFDDYGIIKAEQFDIDKPVVMASIQTLHKRLDKIPPDWFDVVIADECHLFPALTCQKALNHFTPKLRLGLTATPTRMDNLLLGDIFDEITYQYPIERAISEGYLCKPDAIQVKTSTDLDSVHTLAGDFNQKELTETVNSLVRNNLIVNKYLEYAKGRQFIAFCCDVQHAIDLKEAFVEKGVICDYIVGDKELTTDRVGLVSKFKSGEIEGLTNCNILTTGFDHENLGCVILACPTKSNAKYMQSLGRGLRLKDEKFVSKFGQNCIILDIVDNTSRHRLVNTISLDKELPLEEKIFISDKHRQMLLDVKREREMAVSDRKEDERVDLLQLPKVKISNSIRMDEPATEAQLEWIAREGYDIVNNHYTKKHCAQILGDLPAAKWKVKVLAEQGYDISGGVTNNEYNMVKWMLKKKGIEIK